MARIKSPTTAFTPQEEAFAREVAYMMFGSDIKRLGIDVRCETTLYLAYKKAYPRTKATTSSLYNMASRLFKKAKIRQRIEEQTQQFESAVVEATAGKVSHMLDQMLSLTPNDFVIVDEETGNPRKRREHELSTTAWWLIKRTTKYGYEKMTLTEIADTLAKFKGWYKPQEMTITANGEGATADDIVLMFGGKRYGKEDDE